MSISQIAIRRIAEDKALEDETYRRTLERPNRPFTWIVRRMSDEELVAKLHSFNIGMDPVRLDELSRRYPAAYALAVRGAREQGVGRGGERRASANRPQYVLSMRQREETQEV